MIQNWRVRERGHFHELKTSNNVHGVPAIHFQFDRAQFAANKQQE